MSAHASVRGETSAHKPRIGSWGPACLMAAQAACSGHSAGRFPCFFMSPWGRVCDPHSTRGARPALQPGCIGCEQHLRRVPGPPVKGTPASLAHPQNRPYGLAHLAWLLREVKPGSRSPLGGPGNLPARWQLGLSAPALGTPRSQPKSPTLPRRN